MLRCVFSPWHHFLQNQEVLNIWPASLVKKNPTEDSIITDFQFLSKYHFYVFHLHWSILTCIIIYVSLCKHKGKYLFILKCRHISVSKFCHLVYCNIFGSNISNIFDNSYYKFDLAVGLQFQSADKDRTNKTPIDSGAAEFGTSWQC